MKFSMVVLFLLTVSVNQGLHANCPVELLDGEASRVVGSSQCWDEDASSQRTVCAGCDDPIQLTAWRAMSPGSGRKGGPIIKCNVNEACKEVRNLGDACDPNP